MVISPLLLRNLQINIQQKFVRQTNDTTRNFCVSSQQAQPKWRPQTKQVGQYVRARVHDPIPGVRAISNEHKEWRNVFLRYFSQF